MSTINFYSYSKRKFLEMFDEHRGLGGIPNGIIIGYGMAICLSLGDFFYAKKWNNIRLYSIYNGSIKEYI